MSRERRTPGPPSARGQALGRAAEIRDPAEGGPVSVRGGRERAFAVAVHFLGAMAEAGQAVPRDPSEAGSVSPGAGTPRWRGFRRRRRSPRPLGLPAGFTTPRACGEPLPYRGSWGVPGTQLPRGLPPHASLLGQLWRRFTVWAWFRACAWYPVCAHDTRCVHWCPVLFMGVGVILGASLPCMVRGAWC